MSFNWQAALKAPFYRVLGLGDPDLSPECKASYGNGFTVRSRTSANDDSVIDLWQVDSSNRILWGAQNAFPWREQENFYLAPNALLTTQPFWISDSYYYVTAASCSYATADGAANTAQVTIDRGVSAPGSGASIMSNTFNLNTTTNTPQSATLAAAYLRNTLAVAKASPPIAPYSAIVVRPGDRFSFKIASAVTSLAGVIVSVTFAPSNISNCYTYYQNANSRILGAGTQPFANISRPGLTVTGISWYYSAAGTDAGSVTIQVTADADTQAPGAGTALLQSTGNLKLANNTTYNGTLSTTPANLLLGVGNRLSIVLGGTLTALAGLVVTVYTTPTLSQEAMFAQFSNTDLGTNQSFAGPFDRDYRVDEVTCTWSVVSTSMTVTVTADAPGTAPGSGAVILTGTILTSGTINTMNYGTLVVSPHNRILPAGYRLSVLFASTKGTLAGLVVGSALRPI